MAADSTSAAAISRNRQCGASLQQTLNLTRLTRRESANLIQTYKASQGLMSEFFCKVSDRDIPDPNISGLEPPERIASISTLLQAFLPHFKRVYEQQTDLQSPRSPVLKMLTTVRARSKLLAAVINRFYQDLFPNLPLPEPAGGSTALPTPQNIFQQKIYGCVVLRTYKEFLSNVSKELRTLKNKVCGEMPEMNTVFF